VAPAPPPPPPPPPPAPVAEVGEALASATAARAEAEEAAAAAARAELAKAAAAAAAAAAEAAAEMAATSFALPASATDPADATTSSDDDAAPPAADAAALSPLPPPPPPVECTSPKRPPASPGLTALLPAAARNVAPPVPPAVSRSVDAGRARIATALATAANDHARAKAGSPAPGDGLSHSLGLSNYAAVTYTSIDCGPPAAASWPSAPPGAAKAAAAADEGCALLDAQFEEWRGRRAASGGGVADAQPPPPWPESYPAAAAAGTGRYGGLSPLSQSTPPALAEPAAAPAVTAVDRSAPAYPPWYPYPVLAGGAFVDISTEITTAEVAAADADAPRARRGLNFDATSPFSGA